MPSCDEFCITDYGAKFDGTNDTLAWERAFNAISQNGGGKLVLPEGTSKTKRPLRVPSNTIVEGKGAEVTRIENDMSDIFIIAPPFDVPIEPSNPYTLRSISFRDLTVVSQLFNGGHVFALHGPTSATSCTWTYLYLLQFNPGKQIFRRVTNSVHGGFFDCLWEHVYMQHSAIGRNPNAIVPAFEVSAPSQQFNANTLRNLRCENSNTQPFFKFTCKAQQRNNNCIMSQINFEKCYGGMVHWYSAGNWTCEGLVQFDIVTNPKDPTRNDGFYLGRGDIALRNTGPACRHMTFIGCDRRSGIRGRNSMNEEFVDIRLEKINGVGGAEHIVLINCGENPDAVEYTVEANDLPITWIGMNDPTNARRLRNQLNAIRIGGAGEVHAPIIVRG